jgi:hypothetical protein
VGASVNEMVKISLALVAVSVVIGAPLGCSLLTDVGGLTGGRDAGPATAASGSPSMSPSPPPSVRPAVDTDGAVSLDEGVGTRIDASTSSNVDAGQDGASDSGPAATAPFCASLATAPTFCEDLDVTPFGAGWSSTIHPGGAAALDRAQFVSGPSSRRFVVPAGTAGTCRTAQDLRTVSAPYQTRVRVEYDVYLGHAEDTAGVPLYSYLNGFKVSAANGTNPCTVSLTPQEGQTMLSIAGAAANGQRIPLSIEVTPRRWTHVAIEVVSDPGSVPVASVWIDGTIAVNAEAITPNLCGYGMLKTVGVGLFCMPLAPDGEARVDNFLARTD